MTKSLRNTPDVTNAAGLPTSASMSAEVRSVGAASDTNGDDHDVGVGDTDRVPAGNSTLPATALLGLWPLLPTLRLVVELGGVRAAADALGVQAPAVSKAIRQLESTLGEPLFHRVGRTMRPTERAQSLHREVRAAMRVIDTALHAEAPLRLMVHPAATKLLLEAALGLPVSRVQQLADVAGAIAALRRGAVDGVVGVGDVHVGADDVDIVVCGGIDEVEVGGDAGRYEGDDSAAAVVAARLGYRCWVEASAATPDLFMHQRRRRPLWLATRQLAATAPLSRLRAALLAGV